MTARSGPPEVLVIGAGPIGAAAARWLAESGHPVTVVGPAEPAGHEGLTTPWSGHYDSGRLGAIDAAYVPSVLGVRAMRRFDALERASGTPFTSALPLLTTFPADVAPAADDSVASWRNVDALLANVADLGGAAELLDPGAVAQRFPALRVPADQVAVFQPDAVLIDPRRFTAAQLLLAQQAGAARVEAVVTRLERAGARWRAVLRSGESLTTDRVVLAVGAYTNASGLLAPHAPAPVATSVRGCTIVLVEVDGPGAADFPGYLYTSEHHGGGLVTPPRRYPDGRWYLKCAGGELADHPLGSAEEIDAWVRTGGSTAEVAWFRGFLADALPGVRLGEAHTKPCLPTFNASGTPYLERVADGLVLVTEGERGVMTADELGRLAAGLAGEDRWVDPFPSELLRTRWAA